MIRCDGCGRDMPRSFVRQFRQDGHVYTFCWSCSFRWAQSVGITLDDLVWSRGG